MDFKSFEKLERFYLMTNKIEAIQRDKNSSSLKGQSSEKKSGLSIKNDGTYTRG